MVIERSELFWVDLRAPAGSGPGKRRPVLVIAADRFNATRLATVVVAVITSNTTLAGMPGNVFLPAGRTGLARDSVVNVTGLLTVDKNALDGRIGKVPDHLMKDVDRGLKMVLGL